MHRGLLSPLLPSRTLLHILSRPRDPHRWKDQTLSHCRHPSLVWTVAQGFQVASPARTISLLAAPNRRHRSTISLPCIPPGLTLSWTHLSASHSLVYIIQRA